MSAVEIKVEQGELMAYAGGLRRAVLVPPHVSVEQGDQLVLREYDEQAGVYVGPWLLARVTHVGWHSRRGHGPLLVVSLEPERSGVSRPVQRRVGVGEDARAA